MKYKYQLILLGTQTTLIDDLINILHQKLDDLGLNKEIIRVITNSNFDTDYVGNQPAFSYYFGDTNGDFKDINIAKKILEEGTMVLPIYFSDDEESFKKEIPDALHNQNGIRYSENERERIVNIALEGFELLRSTRKVFISYKRNESTSIAIQLYEALEQNNFDVFLDTHSIGKAEPFQEELWHRMTDCDVIILLNTCNFLESHWCKEEFAEAGAKQIGIIQLVWPNNKNKIDSSSHISYPKHLTNDNFVNGVCDSKDNSKFTEDFIIEVIRSVESFRARNLAARQDNLITEFRNIAERNGRTLTIQPEKFLTENLANGKHIIYIPTIGIPQSTSCQEAEIKKDLLNYNDVAIRLIYDDLRIRDKWLKHLDWLNDNLKKDIQTLKKQDFESWLQKK